MISQQAISKARSTNLFEFLSQRGYILQKEGGQFRLQGYAGLIVTENKWFSHSAGIGGNPIDLLMHIENLTFREAVLSITDNMQTSKMHVDPYLYLTRKRAVNEELVNDLMSLDIITIEKDKIFFHGYENQENLANLVTPKCSSWRSSKDSTRGELKDSDKFYSFSIPDYQNKSGNRTLIIAEGPIDILSIASLEVMNQKEDFYQTYKIALCGLNQKNITERIKNLNPSNIHLALDNDPPGKTAAEILSKTLQKIAPTKIITYNAKDPNELLIKLTRPN